MLSNKKQNPMVLVVSIFCVCFVFRFIEYMLIQTDRTILGEAFLHKLAGIAVMIAVMKMLQIQKADIGFGSSKAGKSLLYGFLAGAAAFVVAYGTEIILLAAQGAGPVFKLYVSAYSMDGNIGERTGLGFFALCIAGNLINVIMEEGIFRGLFLKVLEKKYSFVAAAIVSSALFGLWHIMAPLRSYIEGNMQLSSLLMASLLQVLTTGLAGFMFCLVVKIAGNLYAAMAVHFVNNTIINILHVVTQSGADEMQFVRIAIAQTLTFVVALCIYLVKKKSLKQTFR